MTKPVKRSYDGTQRQAQARVTRARIRDAAADLFIDRGYAATTIAMVAERAEVSSQTVFATFGTKANLLSEAIDVALAGDDRPIPVAERPESQAVGAAPTAAEAAATFAAMSTQVMVRAGRLLRVADAAAQQDADLHPRWLAGHQGRLQDMTGLAHMFDAAGFLRDDVTVDAAADLLWALSDPFVYCSFTLIRGFTDAEYEQWLAATVSSALFA